MPGSYFKKKVYQGKGKIQWMWGIGVSEEVSFEQRSERREGRNNVGEALSRQQRPAGRNKFDVFLGTWSKLTKEDHAGHDAKQMVRS